jgi:hypothetical protein
MDNLVEAKRGVETCSISGVGPTLFGRNGGGSLFFTDGDIAFARLAGCETREGVPEGAAPPARIAAKNLLFSWLAALWQRLPAAFTH